MLQAGQILQERYQLKRKLGQNAGRQTWLAKDLQAKPPEAVVIKLLTFGGDVQWDDLKLFEREAKVLKQLDHPHIPKYRDYFSIDDRALWFGLVQDYIPGHSLKNLLTQGKKFTEIEVRKIAVSVLKILIYLHKLNPPVLHRDIKPSNLIWGQDEELHLVDFGAVQDRATAEGATFTVVGTYGYAPLEQFGGRTVPASDLYALGATLVHLLTGVAPADLPQSDLTIEFRDRTNASAHLLNWIERLIEPSLKRRFSQAQEALNSLKTNSSSKPVSRAIITPTDTRIKIKNEKDQLVVAIAPKEQPFWLVTGVKKQWLIQEAVVTLIGFGLISLLTLLSLGLGILVILICAGSFFVYFFFIYLPQVCTHKRVVINRKHFLIQTWYFNELSHEHQGLSKEILDVFQSVQISGEDDPGKEMITIQTSTQRYSFGLGLSAVECVWIAQEIKSWLGLER